MPDPTKLISEEPFKIGTHVRGHGIVEFHYDDIFEPQMEQEPPRLLIAPSSGHIALIHRLRREMPPPYFVMYVLVAPQTDAEPGRYVLTGQDEETVHALLDTYRDFLEGDARHHLWIGSETDGALLVYDQHNVIYAYGRIDQFAAILRAQGLQAGRVQFPFPHTHHFRSVMSPSEQLLLESYPWKRLPLEEEDLPE